MLALVGVGFVHTGLPTDAPLTGRVFRNDPLAKHLPRGGVTRASEPPQLAYFGLRSPLLFRRLPPMILRRAQAARLRDRERAAEMAAFFRSFDAQLAGLDAEIEAGLAAMNGTAPGAGNDGAQ